MALKRIREHRGAKHYQDCLYDDSELTMAVLHQVLAGFLLFFFFFFFLFVCLFMKMRKHKMSGNL